MSIIVGMVSEGVVYLGADSQITSGGSRIVQREEENYKIWRYKEKDIIIATAGSLREMNLIKASEDLFDELDIHNMEIDVNSISTKTVKRMFKILVQHNVLKDEKPYVMNNEYLIGFKGNLYHINSDGAVYKVNDYVAIGSARYEALGVLLSSKETSPIKKISTAINTAIKCDIHCDYPIIIMQSISGSVEVIERNKI